MSKYSYKPDSLLPRVYPQNEHALDRAGGLRVDKLSLDLEVVRDLANPHLCPIEFLPILAYKGKPRLFFPMRGAYIFCPFIRLRAIDKKIFLW